jgi:hypothetical protein
MRTPAPKAPAVNKSVDHRKQEPSAAQLNPNLASPTDFEILENGGLGGETLPLDGSCGDTASEYHKLLRIGRAGNKKKFVPPDEHGRSIPQ